MKILTAVRLGISFLLATFLATGAHPATLQVGPGKPFQTITAAVAAAQSGDTIDVDAGIYPNETMTISQDNLTLRGVGGRAHMRWGTGDWHTNTALIDNGKAILVISGNDVTIENIELSGALVEDENGAGIRYEGGDLTIRGSYFHHNENGILGQGGPSDTLLIEHSIFERNGHCWPCAHNVYIGNMGRLIFRHNKSVDSQIGHTLKSRANVNEVVGNYFSTKNSDGSYEVEFPNGGTVYFIGNIVEQGVNTDNPILLAYAQEGASNPGPALYVINNTFNNLRVSGTFLGIAGAPALTVRNNIFAGGGTIGVAVDASNKVLPASTFVNAAGGDYHLAAGSPAIDAGGDPGTAGSFNLTPQWEYVEPAGKSARFASGSALDAGAYEYSPGSMVTVAKAGSGSGIVTGGSGAIQCGLTCSAAFASGGSVTLNATPAAGNVFTGWLGPCTGTGSCTIAVTSNTAVSATFAGTDPGPDVLDVDGNDQFDALTDGLLALRFMFGITGPPLVNGAIGFDPIRQTAAQVGNYLTDIKPMLDIDGDGRADALTDGILAIRYLFGLRGTSLINGVVAPGAIRTTPAAIEAQLQGLSPPAGR